MLVSNVNVINRNLLLKKYSTSSLFNFIIINCSINIYILYSNYMDGYTSIPHLFTFGICLWSKILITPYRWLSEPKLVSLDIGYIIMNLKLGIDLLEFSNQFIFLAPWGGAIMLWTQSYCEEGLWVSDIYNAMFDLAGCPWCASTIHMGVSTIKPRRSAVFRHRLYQAKDGRL